MDEAERAARAYARIRYRLLLVHLAGSLSLLGCMQFSGFSHALARFWQARCSLEPFAILGYLSVFGPVYYLALLPLHIYSSFHLEHRFGLSRLSWRAWWLREAKQIVLSAFLSGVLIGGLYHLLRHAPGSWTLWATIGWVGVSVILARIFPTLLLPLFYKTAPLREEALAKRLLELCRRAKVSVLGVFRFDLGKDTRKANAALAGLGKSRRVLLSDTLLQGFTPDEIEGVLAHELAHQRYRHMTKTLVLSAFGSWVAFALTDLAGRRWLASLNLRGLWDIAGFPMLALWFSLLGLLSLPLQNGLSRYFERQADRFAVEFTSAREAFAGALRRLARLNLADPHPPRWLVWLFYDHPPIEERIAAAQRRV